MSLQVDDNVAFEDVPVFGVCRPACYDSSLYIFSRDIVHIYRGVVNHHLCLCGVHLMTHSPTFIEQVL